MILEVKVEPNAIGQDCLEKVGIQNYYNIIFIFSVTFKGYFYRILVVYKVNKNFVSLFTYFFQNLDK